MEIRITAFKDSLIKDLIKEEVSRKFYKYLKRCNHTLEINGKEVKNYFEIKQGEELVITYDDLEFETKPLNIKLEVIYEDDNYLIVNKPQGLPTIPKNKDDSYSLYNAIYNYYLENNISASIHFISRLDEETMGLIMVAKNKNSSRILNDSKDNFSKYYYAVVEGKLDSKEGLIDKPILKTEDNKRIIDLSGKPSKTIYNVIKEKENESLVHIKLLTGRTHQIRLHFLSLGHPLVGDKIYNPLSNGKFCLCAYKLEIIDPFDKKNKSFEISPCFLEEW